MCALASSPALTIESAGGKLAINISRLLRPNRGCRSPASAAHAGANSAFSDRPGRGHPLATAAKVNSVQPKSSTSRKIVAQDATQQSSPGVQHRSLVRTWVLEISGFHRLRSGQWPRARNSRKPWLEIRVWRPAVPARPTDDDGGPVIVIDRRSRTDDDDRAVIEIKPLVGWETRRIRYLIRVRSNF